MIDRGSGTVLILQRTQPWIRLASFIGFLAAGLFGFLGLDAVLGDGDHGDNMAIGQGLLLRASIYRGQGDLEQSARMLSEVEQRLRRSLPAAHIAFASLASQQSLNAQARGDAATVAHPSGA